MNKLFNFNWLFNIISLPSMNKKDNSPKNIKSFHEISYSRFPNVDDEGRIKRYEYYDVDVKGTIYRDFDISIIQLDHIIKFEFEPDNEYDSHAIKILYDDVFIGYIPKNNLQEMVFSYCNGEKQQIYGFITEINRKTKELKIGLGFYDMIK